MKDRLYRSRRVRVFGGVAGGLAQYFNLDPILIRVLFVLITILHGFGILLYIILWIVVPEEPFELAYKVKPDEPTTNNTQSETGSVPSEIKKSGSGRIVIGVILIALGIIFLADRILPWFDFRDAFPIVFILIGGALIWNSMK